MQDSTALNDSLNKVSAKDSVNRLNSTQQGNTFKAVVGSTTDSSKARNRYNKLLLYKRNVVLYTNDSVTYKIAETFTLPLSDTTRIKDSLYRFYGKNKVKIEH